MTALCVCRPFHLSLQAPPASGASTPVLRPEQHTGHTLRLASSEWPSDAPPPRGVTWAMGPWTPGDLGLRAAWRGSGPPLAQFQVAPCTEGVLKPPLADCVALLLTEADMGESGARFGDREVWRCVWWQADLRFLGKGMGVVCVARYCVRTL